MQNPLVSDSKSALLESYKNDSSGHYWRIDSFIQIITHLLPGPVLGPRDTSMIITISAFKELKSEEKMTFTLLLCAMRRDNKDICKTGWTQRSPDEDGIIPLWVVQERHPCEATTCWIRKSEQCRGGTKEHPHRRNVWENARTGSSWCIQGVLGAPRYPGRKIERQDLAGTSLR